MLLGRSPLRISFVGGGTDLEEYHKKYDGYSISATIDKFTFVAAKLRDDKTYQGLSPDYHTYFSSKKLHGIRPKVGHEIALTSLQEMNFSRGIDMFFSADVAPGSGLGASSSLASNIVNIILKLQKKKWSKHKIAMKVFRIGHLGDFNDLMLAGTLAGVEMGLKQSGIPFKPGGIMAALDFLSK